MLPQNKNANLYHQVYQDLKKKILTGELSPNSKLPTVEMLSGEYGVSKITTKKATDMLVQDGLLLKHPGKGTYVSFQASPSETAEQPRIKPKSVGVIMDGISDSFGVKTLIALELALGQAGYSCLIKFSNNNESSETACINKLLDSGVSGLIIKCSCFEVYNDRILELSLQNFPMIFADRNLPGLRGPYVGIDHIEACRTLCDHMFARGHKELVLAYCDQAARMTSISQRIEGYTESYLRNRGHVNANHLILPGDSTMSIPNDYYPQAMEAAENYLTENQQVTGVIALSEGIGQMLILAARKIAENTGRHIEIAQFDPTNVRFPECRPVTYVLQDEAALAQACAEKIIQRIEGKKVDKLVFTPFTVKES